jgi:glycosyltransferase involved in cell wall biosynthesis
MMRVINLLRKLDLNQWGGTETAIQRLCDGLRYHDVDPVIYCPRLDQPPHDEELERIGCDIKRFRAFVPVLGLSPEQKRQMVSLGGNLMSFDLITSLWNEENVDIIHSHALGRIGGIGLTVARKRKIPFVVSVHGGVFDLPEHVKKSFTETSSSGWEWGKLFGLLFQSHRLFGDADAIITCNQKEASLLQEKYPAKRVAVQSHGVPFNLYEKDHRDEVRQAYPQIIGREALVSVGRIDSIKNQAWLVEQAPAIFSRHPNAVMVLAGSCTEEAYGIALNKKIQELGLADRVILTGGLPPNDPRLIGLMQESAALLLPSVSETFGLVILEGWAAGATPISSRTSGAKALVKQGENGFLFDLDRPETFHAAVDALLADKPRSRAMAQIGHEEVRRNFSVHAVAGKMKALYQELIEQRLCVT